MGINKTLSRLQSADCCLSRTACFVDAVAVDYAVRRRPGINLKIPEI